MSIRQVCALLAFVWTMALFADSQPIVVRISAIEGPLLQVELHPKEVIVLKKGDPPAAVYPEIDGAALAFEVTFDRVEKNENVHLLDIQPLESLARLDEKLGRPPLLHVSWGDGLAFRGVIESVNTRYTMFNPQGIPVRATCNLRFREAERLPPREVVCRASEDCPSGQVCADPDGDGRKTCITLQK